MLARSKVGHPAIAAHARRAAVTIDRMNAENMSAFREHLCRLDSESLFHRFGCVVQQDFLSDYVERAAFLNVASFCCVVDGAVRGIGELRRLDVYSERMAEAALTVEIRYVDRGIGTALMATLLVEAARADIAEVFSIFDPRNDRMRRIVEKFDGLVSIDGASLIGCVRTSRHAR